MPLQGFKKAFRGDGSGRVLWPHTPCQVAAIFVAEVLGTFFLVFIGCMGILLPLGASEGDAMNLQGPLGFGLAVMFIIQIVGHTSDAHLNPAVSLCALLLGRMRIITFFVYVIAQLIGACLGFGLLKAVTPGTCCASCVTMPHQSLAAWQAFLVEFTITSGLILTVCGVWDARAKGASDAVALKLGLTVAVFALVAGSYTGASMNPARSFAPSLWEGIWTDHWVYWVAPLSAGACATLFYMYCLNNPKAHPKAPEEMSLTNVKNDAEAGRRRGQEE